MPAKKPAQSEVIIEKLSVGEVSIWILGISPLIFNCMSAKTKRELLYPKGRKTTADKEQNLKHDPIQEYRDSVYTSNNPKSPTLLVFPSSAIKSAVCNAALEIPGAKKAQIGRLVWATTSTIDIYGIPQLSLMAVRMADIAHTPDIRTRAIVPQWCSRVTLRFVMPTLNETKIARLLEAAGLIMGLGDYRQQKGGASYGQFTISDAKSCEPLVTTGGRTAQDHALNAENPECYDPDSRALLDWYTAERQARGR